MSANNNQNIDKITNEQRYTVVKFLECLKNDNIKDYWKLVSSIDKAYAMGIAEANEYFGKDIGIYDIMYDSFKQLKSNFSNVLDNYGMSQSVRYSKKGTVDIVSVHMYENIQTNITYIAEVEEYGYPINLVLEPVRDENEWGFVWKVLISDKSF